MVVAAPKFAVFPVVALSIPQWIGTCDDLYVDPVGSLFSGGRPWLRVKWYFYVFTKKNCLLLTDNLTTTTQTSIAGL